MTGRQDRTPGISTKNAENAPVAQQGGSVDLRARPHRKQGKSDHAGAGERPFIRGCAIAALSGEDSGSIDPLNTADRTCARSVAAE